MPSDGCEEVAHFGRSVCSSTDMHHRRQWRPTPVLLPGNPMDGGAW